MWTWARTILLLVVGLQACGGGGGSTAPETTNSNSVPSVSAGNDQSVGSGDVTTLAATVSDDDTPSVMWVQTSGPAVALSDVTSLSPTFTAPDVIDPEALTFEITVDDGTNPSVTDSVSITVYAALELSVAFQYFSTDVSVLRDGDEIVIESNGRPNHTSCYWNPDNSSGLYVDCDPDITSGRMSPGYIEDYDNQYSLRIPLFPELAPTPTDTSLGAIGIAVSGAPIFNDQEGPNVELALGVIQGFDRNGAHTGPQTYHYHLEPTAISFDDENLIGVIADGFLLYGRRDYETGTYPTDLDSSGGHVGFTPHSGTDPGDEVYHYHVINEAYLGDYYLLFPGAYQGTPNNISN